MTEDQLYLLTNYLQARFDLMEKESPFADQSKAGEALDKLVESLRRSEMTRRPESC